MNDIQDLTDKEYTSIRNALTEELGRDGETLMRQLNKAEAWGFRVAEVKSKYKRELDIQRDRLIMPAGQKNINNKALTDLDRNVQLAGMTAQYQMDYDLMVDTLERIDKRISACQSQLSLYKQEIKAGL